MISSYIITHLPVFLGLFLFYLLLISPLVEEAIYWYKVRQQRRNGADLGFPYVRRSIPYGIPGFVRVFRYAVKRRLFSDFFLPNARALGFKTFRNQGLGVFQFITSDPENIKTILATKFNEYNIGTRYGSFYPLLGNGVFSSDGQAWKHSRALLRPHFTRQEISHTSTIENHLLTLMSIIDSRGQYGHEGVEVQQLLAQFTLDTATEFLFGFSSETLTDGNPRFKNSAGFGQALSRSLAMLSNRVRAARYYSWIDSKQFHQDSKLCKDFAMEFVTMALEKQKLDSSLKKDVSENGYSDEKNKKYVFIEELAKDSQDPELLRDQTLTLLAAGRDTTSTLLSWVLYYLALKPRVFAKLRSVILAQFGSNHESLDSITFETLKRCGYLRNVINETLRLSPIVPANMREASCDTVLPRGGRDPNSSNPKDESLPILILKGTPIIFNTYVLHHDTDLWGGDADEFRPERWDEPRPNKHMWDFIPFLGGPRICLGQQFALHEASYVIVRLLQTYKDILPGYEGAVVESPDTSCELTMATYPGVNLKFIRDL